MLLELVSDSWDRVIQMKRSDARTRYQDVLGQIKGESHWLHVTLTTVDKLEWLAHCSSQPAEIQ